MKSSGHAIQVRQIAVPEEVLLALQERSQVLEFSRLTTVLHFLHLDVGACAGVAGDPENGCYEWFLFRDGYLKSSDAGYGSDEAALRQLLTKEVGL